MIDAEALSDLGRSFAAALEREDAEAARGELLKTGWLDALELDEAAAVALVFREQGRSGRDVGALDDVLAHHLAARWPAAAGDLAVAHPVAPPSAGTERPSHVVLAARAGAPRLLWLPDLRGAELEVVELAGPLDARPLGGVDPDAGLLGLRGRPAGAATALRGPEAAAAWEPALAAGRRAIAHQLLASAHELLASATAYARERRQYGAAIASFQAVKHRLAETRVALSAADAAVAAAASTGTATAAAVAKALAGRAATTASKHCLQVFGGIGFTLEHEYHARFRRSLVLDRLLGTGRELERELGARLRAGELAGESIVELDDPARLELL